MKLLLCVLFVTACLAASIPEEDNVLVLSPSNFDEAIQAHEYVLVEFYAPWCGHCKKLAPEYAEAATRLRNEGSPLRLAKVDAAEHRDLGSKYGVRGFPTIKFFKNNGANNVEFNGGRTASEIISWLKKKSGPAATPLNSAEEIDKFVAANNVAVVGFFPADSEHTKNFAALASADDERAFGLVTSQDLFAKYDVKESSVIVFKKFDEGKVAYNGDFSLTSLQDFVSAASTPTVIEFSNDSLRQIFGNTIKNIFLYFHNNEKKEYETFVAVAKANKGKFVFSNVDITLPAAKRVVDYFGVTSAPQFLLLQMKKAGDIAKFKPSFTEYTESALQAFADEYLAGNLAPHLKSEEIPANWDAQPVKVLVGKNHDQVVFDENKHVLVEYYAPWCGHCKNLAPVWEKLGEAVKNHPNIVIAKMDSTVNEAKDVSVTGFPTLKFFPAGPKRIVDYTGGRTFEELVDFLEKSTGVSLSQTGNVNPDDDDDDDKVDSNKDEL